MQVRSVKSKKISIFSVVLLFTLILGWLGNYFSPISEVSASDIADDYSVPIVLNHYHVGLDGQIDITTQIDFTATAAFNTLNLSLPYADGQSIIFSGMRTADLTAEVRSITIKFSLLFQIKTTQARHIAFMIQVLV